VLPQIGSEPVDAAWGPRHAEERGGHADGAEPFIFVGADGSDGGVLRVGQDVGGGEDGGDRDAARAALGDRIGRLPRREPGPDRGVDLGRVGPPSAGGAEPVGLG
jgi:hypothetical protein